jgi:hypothetical protein
MNNITFSATGHENILATHERSFEFTKSKEISKDADCIIGVNSDYKLEELEFLKNKVKIKITIEVENLKEEIIAYGSPELTFSDEGFVVRMTNVINSKTGAIYADKSSNTINRELIERMKHKETKMTITIKVIEKYEKLDFYEGLSMF